MEVVVKGIKTIYEVNGEGKDIVLLHGWGASIDSFRPVINYLSRNFRVTALEFPGFGKTPAPDTVWGATEYAEFTLEFLQKLDIKSPVLLGHSFGGRVIIKLLGSKMLSLPKVVLVDSAGIKPKRKLSYYFKVYTFKTIKNILQIGPLKSKTESLIEKARGMFGSTDYKKASGIVRQILIKSVNEDLRHYLPEIKASTLLVWGDKDTDTPISDAKLMEKMIPDSGLVVFKGAGHFSYLERINDFNVIVEHFIREDKSKNV